MYRYKIYEGSLYRKRTTEENANWTFAVTIELYVPYTGRWIPSVLSDYNIRWDTTYVQALKFINQHRRH